MSERSLTITFTVDRTPEEAFAAITNVRGWWSGEIDGDNNSCSGAWNFYIASSLPSLITNGAGRPNPQEGAA